MSLDTFFRLLDSPRLFFFVLFFFSLSTKKFEFELFLCNSFMKLFPAQTHLLKHRSDQSVSCKQLFLLPTAYLKGFSGYFSSNFYQLQIPSAQ